MGVLYFIPARRFDGGRVPDTVKGPALAALGLGHLDGAALTYRGVRNSGPDGGAGLCIGLGVPAGETGIFKDEQTWQACDGGNVWFGWKPPPAPPVAAPHAIAGGTNTAETAVPHSLGGQPGPEVFLRARGPRAAVTLVLGDGNPWGFVPSDALPQRAVFDGSGERSWAPRESDAAHYEACAWLADYAQCGEGRPYFDILDRVALCLGARYHVSALEVVALGLFSTDLNDQVVYACLGVDLAESEKKSDSASGV